MYDMYNTLFERYKNSLETISGLGSQLKDVQKQMAVQDRKYQEFDHWKGLAEARGIEIKKLSSKRMSFQKQIAEQSSKLSAYENLLQKDDTDHELLKAVFHLLSNFQSEHHESAQQQRTQTSEAMDAVIELSNTVTKLSTAVETQSMVAQDARTTALGAIAHLDAGVVSVLTETQQAREHVIDLTDQVKASSKTHIPEAGKVKKRVVKMLGMEYESTKSTHGGADV
ncbi:hypothetical protein OPT61_g1974 [Boeremia exigua]|uniref:Uncharacterized protein n=1 Tax=Boeremia exigua TaxID=749465 RepID=A0ACC2INM6_9PLEO|nr:hypothetical protein OPT61_g1974 [Boeremia exigua]